MTDVAGNDVVKAAESIVEKRAQVHAIETSLSVANANPINKYLVKNSSLSGYIEDHVGASCLKPNRGLFIDPSKAGDQLGLFQSLKPSWVNDGEKGNFGEKLKAHRTLYSKDSGLFCDNASREGGFKIEKPLRSTEKTSESDSSQWVGNLLDHVSSNSGKSK